MINGTKIHILCSLDSPCSVVSTLKTQKSKHLIFQVRSSTSVILFPWVLVSSSSTALPEYSRTSSVSTGRGSCTSQRAFAPGTSWGNSSTGDSQLFISVTMACNNPVNKPAAQAADADPFRCNSTNTQNPPIQKNHHNF